MPSPKSTKEMAESGTGEPTSDRYHSALHQDEVAASKSLAAAGVDATAELLVATAGDGMSVPEPEPDGVDMQAEAGARAQGRDHDSAYLLLSGVELPYPPKYPTLDVLGSLTSATCGQGSTPSQIVNVLRERCRVEAGLILQRELLMEPLSELINGPATASRDAVFRIQPSPAATPDPLASEPAGEPTSEPEPEPDGVDRSGTGEPAEQATVETVHFRERIAQSDRPSGAQAREAAAQGTLVEHSGVRQVRNHIVSVEEHDEELDRPCEVKKTVKVVYDVRARRRVMVTTLYKTRMQLVVLAPVSVAKRILAEEPALKGTLRSDYARSMGSGVSGLTTLDTAAVSVFPADGPDNCDEEAAWADAYVSEELKDYSTEQKGIRRCGINPDFKNLYLRCHRQAVLQSLGSSDSTQCTLPTLYWAPQPGNDGTQVVFLTIVLPESVDLRLLPSATAEGQVALSIAKSNAAHPERDIDLPKAPTKRRGRRGPSRQTSRREAGRGTARGAGIIGTESRGTPQDGSWRRAPSTCPEGGSSPGHDQNTARGASRGGGRGRGRGWGSGGGRGRGRSRGPCRNGRNCTRPGCWFDHPN